MNIDNLSGNYSDSHGNRIIASKNAIFENVKVVFKGENNTIIISEQRSKVSNLNIEFSSDNGIFILGDAKFPASFRGSVRVGYYSLVIIGDDVTATDPIFICAVEKTKILVGDDCMFATSNQIRTDDAHAIYDVTTGSRLNMSKDIVVGAHVWVAFSAKIYGGSIIGDGSIVGLNSIVKKKFANNVTLAGSPAKALRKDIAWERPNVGTKKPWVRTHADQIKKTELYWNVTDEHKEPYLGPSFETLCGNLQEFCPNSHWNEILYKQYIENNMFYKKPVSFFELKKLNMAAKVLFIEGVYFLQGLECREYADFKYRLVLKSEANTYVEILAKGNKPIITEEHGGILNYDKAYFCTAKYQGLDLSHLDSGSYQLYISIKMATGEHNVRPFELEDLAIDKAELDIDGFKIYTEDNNVFLHVE